MQDQQGVEKEISAIEIVNYNHGDLVVKEGEHKRLFYVILQGTVRIISRGKTVRTLMEGDIFGLEQIFFNHPANFTAKVIEGARIASYGPHAADYFLYHHPQMAERIVLSILKQLEVTTEVAAGEEPEISIEPPKLKFYEDGDVIIQEGTVETDIYRLVSTEGGLRVTKKGKEIARITEPGEFFGEMASILKERRTATITSIGKSIVQVYSGESIEELLEEHPDMAKKMIITLANRLAEANLKIVETESEVAF
ncbi:MAG TPA: cyclic nucleotide-binding domain-containing protein [Deltaproteobacteria bacterium]|nr:cyclic nucleotide-binding domain-containing protein [Deltaproteobacteria bacterium]